MQKVDRELVATIEESSIQEFKGGINNSYPIEMSLRFEKQNVIGKYFYKKHKINIDLEGNVRDNRLVLNEYDENGVLTGVFDGKLLDDEFTGRWRNPDGTKGYRFKLYKQYPRILEETESTISFNASSMDWDKVLDDFDAYITQYLKLIKRFHDGDYHAMNEYIKMLEKAEALSSSLEKANSNNDLTSTQIARMLKIQARMIEEM